MNKPTYEEQILSLIAEIFGIENSELSSDTSADDIPMWDSLGHMRLIIALEKKFSIDIDESVSVKLWSVKAICEFLEATLSNKNK